MQKNQFSSNKRQMGERVAYMDKREVEIRTPRTGVRIGNRGIVDGKPVLKVKIKNREDYVFMEELVEAVCGVPVEVIKFKE